MIFLFVVDYSFIASRMLRKQFCKGIPWKYWLIIIIYYLFTVILYLSSNSHSFIYFLTILIKLLYLGNYFRFGNHCTITYVWNTMNYVQIIAEITKMQSYWNFCFQYKTGLMKIGSSLYFYWSLYTSQWEKEQHKKNSIYASVKEDNKMKIKQIVIINRFITLFENFSASWF